MAARRRKYLPSGLLECGQCGGSLIIAGQGRYKRYYCANAKEKGPAVCSGMLGVSRGGAEALILAELRNALMTDAAMAQFRKEFARHLAEQSKGADTRARSRNAAVRRLEEARANFKTAISQGHINPTILEGLTETETRLAALIAESEQDSSNIINIPADLGALYRAHVDDLARTLSAGEVVGRASDELHRLIDRVVVSWDEATQAHHVDLSGDLVALMCAADKEKAASYEAVGSSLRLVAGARMHLDRTTAYLDEAMQRYIETGPHDRISTHA